jgi:hypothetical protein
MDNEKKIEQWLESCMIYREILDVSAFVDKLKECNGLERFMEIISPKREKPLDKDALQDKNGDAIYIFSRVIMPEPGVDDSWSIGGFHARIIDVLLSGDVVVEDQNSDCWQVEPNRLTLDDEM